MSKEACQKEILCMRMASDKLLTVSNQLNWLLSVSEDNYTNNTPNSDEDIKKSIAKSEQIIKQTNQLVKTLNG